MSKKNDFLIHKKVFAELLRRLETLVFTDPDQCQFISNGKISNASRYFQHAGNYQKNSRGFGNQLYEVIKTFYEELSSPEDFDTWLKSQYNLYKGYSKRKLADYYKAYKSGKEWISFSKKYWELYLNLLRTTKDDLFEAAKLTREEQKKQKEELEGRSVYLTKTAPKPSSGKTKTYYYLVSYHNPTNKTSSPIEHALIEFSVPVARADQGSGSVKVHTTTSNLFYEGWYNIPKTPKGHFRNVLSISLESTQAKLPISILLHRDNAEMAFYKFQYLLGHTLHYDNKNKVSLEAPIILEMLDKSPTTNISRSDLRNLSRLKESKYEWSLLEYYLREIRKIGQVTHSTFETKEKFIAHLEEKIHWWHWQKEMFAFFSSPKNQFWYVYFLAKRPQAKLFLARYKIQFGPSGEVTLWGKGNPNFKRQVVYSGYYTAERQGALHIYIKKNNAGNNPDYFHLYLHESQSENEKAKKYFKGTYAGWRMANDLANFAGRLVLIPVKEKKWKSKRARLLPLNPNPLMIKEPAWIQEIKVYKFINILSHLIGKRDYSVDNELAFLPGTIEVFKKDTLSKSLRNLAGIYYLYRTRTRLGRQYTVKRHALLIDENGLVYMTSQKKDSDPSKKIKREKSRLYRGTLVKICLEKNPNVGLIALRKGNKFGGFFIMENTEGVNQESDIIRLLYLNVNFYGEPVCGRIYLWKQSDEVDWEKFKRMKSPTYLIRIWDKNRLQWHVSDALYPKSRNEKVGQKIEQEEEIEILNSLCGQINNFMVLRHNEHFTDIRTNNTPEENPVVQVGSYAEDLLRAATVYWKENNKERFKESFCTAILHGGYNHIGNLRKWFKEDPAMEGCYEELLKAAEQIKTEDKYRAQKLYKHLERILKATFRD